MAGSIVQRKGKRGIVYYVVLGNKWHKVPDPQSKRNAELYRDQLNVERARGEYVVPARLTFADYALRWQQARYPTMTPNTVAGTNTYLTHYILPTFGQRQLNAIRIEDVEKWKNALLVRLAPSTVNTALNRLRAIFRDAVRWGYLRANPATQVRRPPQPKREMSFYTPAQVRVLLDAAPGLQWRAFFLLAITGGLRISEMVAARWRHVEWEQRRYHVREAYTEQPGHHEIRTTKTQYSSAPVTLTPTCLEVLAAWQAEQAKAKLKAVQYEDQGLIFARPNGRPYGPRMIHKLVWDPTVARAGLPRIRFHDLRHTCAALWIELNEPPKFIQQQMRHADIGTTLNVYGHLFPSRAHEAAQRMDNLLFGAA